MMSLKVKKLKVVDPTAPRKDPKPDPVLKKINPLLPKPPFRILLNGPSGSGKSSTFKYLLLEHYPGVFDKIFVFCPTFSSDKTLCDLVVYGEREKLDENGPRDKKGNLITEKSKGAKFKKVRYVTDDSPLQEESVITESDKDLVLQELHSKWEAAKNEVELARQDNRLEPRVLIVFDDLSVELGCSKEIGNYFSKGRKYNISIMLMSNKYRTYPPIVRNNCTHFCFFAMNTKQEEKAILEDMDLEKNDMDHIAAHVFKEPGDFLFVDRDKPVESRFRRNFDKHLKLVYQ